MRHINLLPQEGRRVVFHGAFQGYGFCLMRLRKLTGISSLDARSGAVENKGEHCSLLHHQRDCKTANSKGSKGYNLKKQAKTS
uniref:Uncharacterized protein n=1 Tax=Aotus nancymaae TaxID=37293 RepID=A0A2K5EU32_AOTNA